MCTMSLLRRVRLEREGKGREERSPWGDAPRDIHLLGDVVEEIVYPHADTYPTAPESSDGDT